MTVPLRILERDYVLPCGHEVVSFHRCVHPDHSFRKWIDLSNIVKFCKTDFESKESSEGVYLLGYTRVDYDSYRITLIAKVIDENGKATIEKRRFFLADCYPSNPEGMCCSDPSLNLENLTILFKEVFKRSTLRPYQTNLSSSGRLEIPLTIVDGNNPGGFPYSRVVIPNCKDPKKMFVEWVSNNGEISEGLTATLLTPSTPTTRKTEIIAYDIEGNIVTLYARKNIEGKQFIEKRVIFLQPDEGCRTTPRGPYSTIELSELYRRLLQAFDEPTKGFSAPKKTTAIPASARKSSPTLDSSAPSSTVPPQYASEAIERDYYSGNFCLKIPNCRDPIQYLVYWGQSMHIQRVNLEKLMKTPISLLEGQVKIVGWETSEEGSEHFITLYAHICEGGKFRLERRFLSLPFPTCSGNSVGHHCPCGHSDPDNAAAIDRLTELLEQTIKDSWKPKGDYIREGAVINIENEIYYQKHKLWRKREATSSSLTLFSSPAPHSAPSSVPSLSSTSSVSLITAPPVEDLSEGCEQGGFYYEEGESTVAEASSTPLPSLPSGIPVTANVSLALKGSSSTWSSSTASIPSTVVTAPEEPSSRVPLRKSSEYIERDYFSKNDKVAIPDCQNPIQCIENWMDHMEMDEQDFKELMNKPIFLLEGKVKIVACDLSTSTVTLYAYTCEGGELRLEKRALTLELPALSKKSGPCPCGHDEDGEASMNRVTELLEKAVQDSWKPEGDLVRKGKVFQSSSLSTSTMPSSTPSSAIPSLSSVPSSLSSPTSLSSQTPEATGSASLSTSTMSTLTSSSAPSSLSSVPSSSPSPASLSSQPPGGATGAANAYPAPIPPATSSTVTSTSESTTASPSHDREALLKLYEEAQKEFNDCCSELRKVANDAEGLKKSAIKYAAARSKYVTLESSCFPDHEKILIWLQKLEEWQKLDRAVAHDEATIIKWLKIAGKSGNNLNGFIYFYKEDEEIMAYCLTGQTISVKVFWCKKPFLQWYVNEKIDVKEAPSNSIQLLVPKDERSALKPVTLEDCIRMLWGGRHPLALAKLKFLADAYSS